MADFDDDPVFEILWENKGKTTTRVKSYRLESSYLTAADGFDFTLYSDDPAELRQIDCQPVTLSINGFPQLLGRVEKTVRGGDGSAVQCSGRDYIADIIETNVDPSVAKVTDQTTLASFIIEVASPAGIREVVGDGATRSARTGYTGTTKPQAAFGALKLNEFKAEPGTGCYDFINKVLARHGFTMQPSTRRSAVELSMPNYVQAPFYAIRRLRRGANNNNVISATATRDFSSVPTEVWFTGKQGRSGESRSPMENRLFTEGQIASYIPGGGLSGGKVPFYRLLYHKDDDARNQDQIIRASWRALSERMKDTLHYSVTLKGHTDPETGLAWGIDTIVKVKDEVCEIDEPLWISSRTFSNAPGEGQRTQLECWRPGSFVIGHMSGDTAPPGGFSGGTTISTDGEPEPNAGYYRRLHQTQ